ncbi:glycosyltransferase family 4 protein [Ensifer sp. 4252]|uniref:glycosyltransferase family 4 protein n=1 Tax=Ensifer sp. 4252 TaxID=3373915 RepID=UPI003D259306
MVAYPFVGDEVGGSHISAVGLIRALDRSKYVPLVILHRPGKALEGYLSERGLPFVTSPEVAVMSPRLLHGIGSKLSGAFGYVRTTARLSSFLREKHVDIVHTNDGQMHATWALAARLSGARLLWHHRGDPGAFGVNFIAPILANHIVTVSRYVQPTRPILPVSHKLSVLHSPFDHPTRLPDREACRCEFVRELGLPEETRFVGYVGGLIDRKRPVRFVEAVHAFLQRFPDFPLVGLVFGVPSPNLPNPEPAVRTRALELGVESRIKMMGFRAPVEPCISALDALLVPAVNEPFGRTLIEAMLLETPVIATRHGGNVEAIVDDVTGFLVEPEKPEAFVDPLAKLLMKVGEHRRIRSAARASALTKYGTAAHVEGISLLYERIVGRNDRNIGARTTAP